MITTFAELLDKKKNVALQKMGRDLASDIVKEVKQLNETQGDVRKELNKARIKALGLKLIQGGKV